MYLVIPRIPADIFPFSSMMEASVCMKEVTYVLPTWFNRRNVRLCAAARSAQLLFKILRSHQFPGGEGGERGGGEERR